MLKVTVAASTFLIASPEGSSFFSSSTAKTRSAPAIGSVFVLGCDMIGRSVIAPYELPIELVIGIIGSILFIAMLLYRLNHGRKAIRIGSAANGRSAARTASEGGNET